MDSNSDDTWPFLFCIRQKDLSRREARQTFFKISNGRKVARMAPISMIFGAIESRRCQLNFEEFPHRRTNFRDDENVEKLSRKVRKSLPGSVFERKTKWKWPYSLGTHFHPSERRPGHHQVSGQSQKQSKWNIAESYDHFYFVLRQKSHAGQTFSNFSRILFEVSVLTKTFSTAPKFCKS